MRKIGSVLLSVVMMLLGLCGLVLTAGFWIIRLIPAFIVLLLVYNILF
jgi:hypothetical protein